MDLRNFKPTVIPRSFIIFVMVITILILLINLAKNMTTVNVRTVTIAEEWAYFQGQKDALNGDMRIKYNESTHKYSWQKSCWDEGTRPIFDPSESEDVGYFLKK